MVFAMLGDDHPRSGWFFEYFNNKIMIQRLKIMGILSLGNDYFETICGFEKLAIPCVDVNKNVTDNEKLISVEVTYDLNLYRELVKQYMKSRKIKKMDNYVSN